MKMVTCVRLLFILTAASASLDDLPWAPLPSSPEVTTVDLASALLSASTYLSTEAPPAAPRNISDRLPDAMEVGLRNHYDEERCEAASGGHWLHPASDSAPVASTAETWGSCGSASREIAGLSKGTPNITGIEDDESGLSFLPPTVNWTPWLPVWCREQWPFEGTLNVTRETLLRAFSEALTEYSVGIANYWAQTAEPADKGEEDGNEEQRTPLVSTAIEQTETLFHLYRWMYHKLENSEPDGDLAPESLYRFLDALEQQSDWVESICNWSPSMRWTCFAEDAEILQDFFWVMDRQQIWVRIFHRWADNQYVMEGHHRPPGLWLPLNEGTLPFNVPPSRNQTPGDDGSAVEAVGHGVCTNERATITASYERFGDISSESAARSKSWPVTQFVPQDKPRNKKSFPTCRLESIRTTGQETEPFMESERTPIRDRETEMSPGGRDESEGARALPRNRPDRCELVIDVGPDESLYDKWQPVLQLMDEQMGLVEDSSPQLMVPNQGYLESCSETPVLQELGPAYEPPFVTYVTCDDGDQACQPPSKCSPVRGLVSVEMSAGTPLPDVPSDGMAVWPAPSGNMLLTIVVDTSCECREQPDEN